MKYLNENKLNLCLTKCINFNAQDSRYEEICFSFLVIICYQIKTKLLYQTQITMKYGEVATACVSVQEEFCDKPVVTFSFFSSRLNFAQPRQDNEWRGLL